MKLQIDLEKDLALAERQREGQVRGRDALLEKIKDTTIAQKPESGQLLASANQMIIELDSRIADLKRQLAELGVEVPAGGEPHGGAPVLAPMKPRDGVRKPVGANDGFEPQRREQNLGSGHESPFDAPGMAPVPSDQGAANAALKAQEDARKQEELRQQKMLQKQRKQEEADQQRRALDEERQRLAREKADQERARQEFARQKVQHEEDMRNLERQRLELQRRAAESTSIVAPGGNEGAPSGFAPPPPPPPAAPGGPANVPAKQRPGGDDAAARVRAQIEARRLSMMPESELAKRAQAAAEADRLAKEKAANAGKTGGGMQKALAAEMEKRREALGENEKRQSTTIEPDDPDWLK